MKKIAIYPGTFDPLTNGHLDVIERALNIFDELIIAIALNEAKKPKFDLDFRLHCAKLATSHLKNVRVKGFSGLLVDFAKEHNASCALRGLRAVSDFEFELQMNYANASLQKGFDTFFLMPNLKYAFISSSIVRSIYEHGGDISHLVPEAILKELERVRST